MNSISFTNPYLLFVGIALLAVVLVPFFLSIKKIGFNFHNITSLVIHGVLAVLVTLALAGMTLTLVMTETDVYVLADCYIPQLNNVVVYSRAGLILVWVSSILFSDTLLIFSPKLVRTS